MVHFSFARLVPLLTGENFSGVVGEVNFNSSPTDLLFSTYFWEIIEKNPFNIQCFFVSAKPTIPGKAF